jgi:transposase
VKTLRVIALRADHKVVLATQPVDFRKSVHTLSALVSEALHANPYCGDVFVFRSKRMSKRKIAASLSIGATAAGDCVRRARRAGLSWPLGCEFATAMHGIIPARWASWRPDAMLERRP